MDSSGAADLDERALARQGAGALNMAGELMTAAPVTTETRRREAVKRSKRIALRTLTAACAAAASIVCAEAVTRRLDGFAIVSWRLVRVAMPKTPDDDVAASYVARLPVAPGVNRSWFDDEPRVASGGNTSPDPELTKRFASHGFGLPSMYEWNLEYLRAAACATEPSRYENVRSSVFPVNELFVFEPLGRAPHPRYRFLRNARYPNGLITNSFGWRGPDLSLNKPANTIRLAFVGASTTVAPHDVRYSYPDFIRRWLEHWAEAKQLPIQFEVINAGREGIDSTSIAAVVRDELAPLEPDLVVYYEGANQFGPAVFILWPGGIIPGRPAPARPGRLASVSALALRFHALSDPFAVPSREPRKPRLTVEWPADLDEQDPPLDHPRLPLLLPTIMRDFDEMRTALSAHGGRLAISSFVWCVREGLQLDRGENAGVYQYLNEMFWPFSYAYMRRLADFQNRVFAKYAKTHGLDFVDVAAGYPLDPRLFEDGIHMRAPGTKLMAWISFQYLVPVLERSIAAGQLPQAARRHRDQHPGFTGPPRALLSVASIRASCRTS
jgi:hypothetical protein